MGATALKDGPGQDRREFAGGAKRGTPVRLHSFSTLTQDGDWRMSLPHAHDHDILLWITRGQGLALLDGVRRGFGTHNVVWVPAGTQIAMETGIQTFGQVLSLHGTEADLLPRTPQHLRIRDVGFQAGLNGFIDMLQRELQQGQPLQDEAVLAVFRLVQIWFRRMMLQAGDETDRVRLALPEPQGAGHRLAERFARRVEGCLTSGWTMAEYAADLGVTPTHLTRVCREASGMTAADLLTARLLHEARHLLCDTEVPAQDIARHLGFGSAAYFSRFVQKHTGSPPSAHRQKTCRA